MTHAVPLRLMCLAAALLFCSHCGYRFMVEGPGPSLGEPAAARSSGPPPRLTVTELDNVSFEPGLAHKYTEYLRQAFTTGSGAKVVGDGDTVDLELKGAIREVLVPSLSFSTAGTFESRVIVTVDVSVRDLRANKIVWRQRATGAAEFFVTNNLQFNRVLQRRAMEQAGIQIAGDLAARFQAHLYAAQVDGADSPTSSDGPPGSPEIPLILPAGGDPGK
jgi:hypothetical protein